MRACVHLVNLREAIPFWQKGMVADLILDLGGERASADHVRSFTRKWWQFGAPFRIKLICN
jgi:hypothetical protein